MLWLLALTLTASEPMTASGIVRTSQGAVMPTVSLHVEQGEVLVLAGDLVPELQRLAGVKVEVTGQRDGRTLVPMGYVIVDLGKGVRPDAVGTLVELGNGLAVQDGKAAPIALSVSPKLREKLNQRLGAKLWVSGRKLLSGEVKVTQFGVLRDAVKAPAPLGPPSSTSTP